MSYGNTPVDGFMTFYQFELDKQGLLSPEEIGECGRNAKKGELEGGAQPSLEAQTEIAARLSLGVPSRGGGPEAR